MLNVQFPVCLFYFVCDRAGSSLQCVAVSLQHLLLKRYLWHTGLVLWLVGSSQTVDGTHVTCMGRWLINHWTTREALVSTCDDAAKTRMYLCTFLVVPWDKLLESNC